MVIGAIIFNSTHWLALAALFVVIASVSVWWSYRRSHAPVWVRVLAAALKVAGIAALAFALLEPMWTRERARPGANFFLVLVDNSQGMTIQDAQEKPRSQIASELLEEEWVKEIEKNFQVRKFAFDRKLRPIGSATELDFEGQSSRLHGALKDLQDRYANQPVAGAVIISDGNATDAPLSTPAPFPVYAVLTGSDKTKPDAGFEKGVISQSAFEDSPATVSLQIGTTGLQNQKLKIELTEAGKETNRVNQVVAVEKGAESVPVQLTVRPSKLGVSFFKATITNENSAASEATTENNTRWLVVDRGGGPYRILYTSGRPNWEYKFLARSIDIDESFVEMPALIRIARKEPKFEFRGRQGEASNPLFRGFDKTNEETERYDQPVLTRINTRDEHELKNGFPKTAEELFQYDAVIVDDLEAEFFTRDQMLLLQRYVSERGGSFLMLGGTESFATGKYQRTPIGEMIPVYLTGEQQSVGNYVQGLSRDGWLQPWVRLRKTEAEELARLDQGFPMQVLNEHPNIKPGARVMSVVTDARNREFPAFVYHKFGRGFSAAFLVGDLWRTGLKDENTMSDLHKSWRQMLRWLVSDVPGRLQITATPDAESDAIQVKVKAHDKSFNPLENGKVTLQVSQENRTNSVTLQAEPSDTEPGVYVATYISKSPGAFRAKAIVLDSNGVEAGRVETGWTSDPSADEFKSIKPNPAVLEQIARQSGGQMLRASDLPAFARELPGKSAPIKESYSTPLWHSSWFFLLAMLCFVSEWGLRRTKGLP